MWLCGWVASVGICVRDIYSRLDAHDADAFLLTYILCYILCARWGLCENLEVPARMTMEADIWKATKKEKQESDRP